MNINYKFRILNYFIITFIIILSINIFFNPDWVTPIISIMTWDINATINYWFWDFAKVFAILFGETGIISVWFYHITNKMF